MAIHCRGLIRFMPYAQDFGLLDRSNISQSLGPSSSYNLSRPLSFNSYACPFNKSILGFLHIWPNENIAKNLKLIANIVTLTFNP